MKITHYGYDNFFSLIGAGMVLVITGSVVRMLQPESDMPAGIVPVALVAFGVLIILFALWFFRDPHRTIPQEVLDNDALIIAPADGKLVQILEVNEPRLIQGKAIRLSIFLSPLDVHVNRIPANGEIVFSDYQPGKFLVAMDHRASEENEQSIIGLRNSKGSLIFKQMTGFLARRIVNEAKLGQQYRAGDQFGMMKFGSRMDVIVPASATILVREGERMTGGITLMCRLA